MIKHKPIEDYLLRNSNVERARENTFLKHAYEELAVELGDTCPICNKFVDDVDDHIDKVHGGKQKTLFEEAFGKPYQVSGGWEELDPPRYPHSKLPKEFVGDERNLTEDFSEEFFDTADVMPEYDNIPTDNMKHQTQNLQNSIDEGRWDEEDYLSIDKERDNIDAARKNMQDKKRYLDISDMEPDVADDTTSFPYQQGGEADIISKCNQCGFVGGMTEMIKHSEDTGHKDIDMMGATETLPEQDGTFYTHDGKAEDWDIPYYKVPDNYYTDKGDEQSNDLKDTRHEERDMLKGYGIADKTLHELGLDELEGEEQLEDPTPLASIGAQIGQTALDIIKQKMHKNDSDKEDNMYATEQDPLQTDPSKYQLTEEYDEYQPMYNFLTKFDKSDINYAFTELQKEFPSVDYQTLRSIIRDWSGETPFGAGSEAKEGAHGSGRRGHEQWMNPTEIIDKKTDEDLRRDNFITRAEEIIEDFKPEFTSEQLLKTDCSNCSQKSYDKIFKALEAKPSKPCKVCGKYEQDHDMSTNHTYQPSTEDDYYQ